MNLIKKDAGIVGHASNLLFMIINFDIIKVSINLF